MRLDFYLSARHPVDRVLPAVAAKAREAGQRLLVVSDDSEQLDRLGAALWAYRPEAFLANGRAGEPHAERQPILLSAACEAANGARLIALADGQWRPEAEAFDRVLLFFGETGREAARAVWRQFDAREDVERGFHDLDQRGA